MNAFIADTFDICPRDLKKLEIAKKFNLLEREEKLWKIFRKLKYKEEIKLTMKKIKKIVNIFFINKNSYYLVFFVIFIKFLSLKKYVKKKISD